MGYAQEAHEQRVGQADAGQGGQEVRRHQREGPGMAQGLRRGVWSPGTVLCVAIAHPAPARHGSHVTPPHTGGGTAPNPATDRPRPRGTATPTTATAEVPAEESEIVAVETPIAEQPAKRPRCSARVVRAEGRRPLRVEQAQRPALQMVGHKCRQTGDWFKGAVSEILELDLDKRHHPR